MAGGEITEVGSLLRLPPPLSLTVTIAIKGNSKSKDVVNWALEKFVPEGKFMFKLIHVRPVITAIPTAVGSFRLSEMRDDLVNAYRYWIECQTEKKLLTYKRMCTRKMVQAEIVQIESDDVIDAISREIDKSTVNKLVIGASSRGMALRRQNVSSEIAESIPKFCTVYAVYAVSKGKLSSLCPSDEETLGSIKDESSETSSSTHDSSTYNPNSHAGSIASCADLCFPFRALSTVNQTLLHKKSKSTGTLDSRFTSLEFDGNDIMTSTGNLDSRFTSLEYDGDDIMTSCPGSSDIGRPSSSLSSPQILETDTFSWVSHQATFGDATTSDDRPEFSSENQIDVDLEIERLRSELRPPQKLYPMTRIDAIDGSKVNDLNDLLLKESIKLGQINYEEEEAKELAIQEVVKYEAARQEAEHVKECAEREAANRAHKKAKKKEKLENALGGQEKLENALGGPLQQYQKFEWEDIVSATSNFSENLKIGYGAYGTVYKCSLNHTTTAVKVLYSKEAHRNKQFQQELEVLSTIRHPHLLILLGACPDHGCLVYEYMENGSLEDVLFRRNNTPPIPWFQRYRIAWEIASALVFLHSTNPQPIIHYDLKPANILLDQNFVSKIGDVGLSKMLDFDRYSPFFSSTYIETRLMGSVDYIDPEYQRTGLVSTKSDVYAFGKVILQLVTGKVARGLTCVVETAIDEWNLAGVFDHEAGNWPVEETIELAMLGMRCAEWRSKHRPSLRDEVLPALERLKEFADKARDLYNAPPGPPIYPILQNVMDYSCVAADGYTYDRRAIETWLEENDDSPNTNLPSPNFAIFDNPVFAV